jgi:GT2 family glycosyltransferase
MSIKARTHIAVLMTCHSRRDTTLRCLASLYDQNLSEDIAFQVYLVDDGSTDNTGKKVSEQFPDVTILQGDGQLYWGGGMRKAWALAMEGDYDHYLWLNDDTFLYSNALSNLLNASKQVLRKDRRAGIVVGSTQGVKSKETTYGGIVRKKKGRNLSFALVVPRDVVVPCDTINGNCALVPREIAETLGNLSGTFTHYLGDFDYGLRALEKGLPVYVCPGHIGSCDDHPSSDCFSPSVPFIRRWRKLHSAKGLPPKEWAIFLRRHVGWKWPFYMFKLYLRVVTPFVWRLKESS